MGKTITVKQFLRFRPCIGDDEVLRIAGDKERWSAQDILMLKDIPAEDRLWAVLRPQLIDEPILHEFACRCAEQALSLIDNPHPDSVAATDAKRAWLRDEITDKELTAAEAAAEAAAGAAAEVAARAAEAAAWAAARDMQVKMLVDLIIESEVQR